MEAHDPTPHRQHRVQAPGGAGLPGGGTLHSLARRHDLLRNLIRIWIPKFEAGAFNDKPAAADAIEAYEARIAALERLVGRQALEIAFLKGALKHGPRPGNATASVVTGSTASPSPKDAACWSSSMPGRAGSSVIPRNRHMVTANAEKSSECHIDKGNATARLLDQQPLDGADLLVLAVENGGLFDAVASDDVVRHRRLFGRPPEIKPFSMRPAATTALLTAKVHSSFGCICRASVHDPRLEGRLAPVGSAAKPRKSEEFTAWNK